MALAVDGHVLGNWSSGTSFTAPGLTTANAGDVIVGCVVTGSTSLVKVSSLSTPGVVWNSTPRKQLTWNTTFSIEIWHGVAAAALSSVTTTVNLTGTPSSAARASVFGVSGANTGSISDPNASLPATATGAASAPTTTGVSTSNANDMIIAVTGHDNKGAETAGSGFTLIDSGFSSTTNPGCSTEDKVVSATQSSISVAFGTATGTGQQWAMVVDAIQAFAAVPVLRKPLPVFLRR